MPSGKSNRPQSSSAAKSAKALKAAKSKSRSSSGKSVVKDRQIPWLSVGAGIVVLALIASIAAFLVPKYEERADAQRFVPSASNTDPSTGIDGVTKIDYAAGQHVQAAQRVAYDQSPPFGGPHDQVWATCLGNVYPSAIRTENAVHSLEHGAVWITYNPQTLSADQVQTLESKVAGQPYLFMSPYPGLDTAFSMQSWGHQLKLQDVSDERVTQFISALKVNPNTYPEVGASCDAGEPSLFDPDNPPAFDASAPGAGAIPMSGAGTEQQMANGQESAPSAAPAPAAPAASAPAPAAPAPSAVAPAGS